MFRLCVVLAVAGALAALAPVSALAQRGTLTGTVTDQTTNVPLGSAQVFILGANVGGLTNSDGRYLIANVPSGEHRLRAELIGYRSAEEQITVQAGQTVQVNLALTSSPVDLEGLVISVDGSEARRMEFGTDIERFDAAQTLEQGAVTSLSELLTSRAPGLQVQQGSGGVGTASRITLRGVASMTMASNPIVIVDGIRVNNRTDTGPASIDWSEGRTISRLDDINPNEIADVQVIKGPTATALYGSDAASGVIIITTKTGGVGAAKFTMTQETGILDDRNDYDTYKSYYNFTRFMGITDVNDPVAQQWSATRNPVTGDVWGVISPLTDPLTSPLKTGYSTDTNLQVSGGVEGLTYFVAGRFENTSGVIPVNDVERYSLRGNFTASPTDNLEVSFNAAYYSNDVRVAESGRSFRGYSTNGGLGNATTSFGHRPDGSRGDCLATLLRGDPASVCENRQGNLIATFDQLHTIYGGQRTGRSVSSIRTTWRPTSWLSSRLVAGVDHAQMHDLNEFPLDEALPFGPLSLGYVRDNRITNIQRTVEWSNTVQAKLGGDVTSTTVAGVQYFETSEQSVGCIGEGGFASPTANACGAALIRTGYSNRVDNKQLGVYSQQRFGYRNYLYGSAGIRLDDNSAFGFDQGAIWSPSLNGSAVLTEMPFWDWDLFSTVRVRGAWGNAAQAPPPNSALQRLLPVILTDPNVGDVAGIQSAYPGNPELTAERKSELEMGIDAALLQDRLAIKVTHFRQKTTDAIITRFLAPSSGFRGEQFVNVGELQNNGWEFEVNADLVRTSGLNWSVDLSHTTQNPLVTSMGGLPPLFVSGSRGFFKEGYAPGSYYGPIVQSAQRDANGTTVPGSMVIKPGDLSGDRSYLGSPQARNTQHLSTNLELFGGIIRFYTLFERRGDVTKTNEPASQKVTQGGDISGTWHWAFRQERLTAEQQVALEESSTRGSEFRRFVFAEDGSFIRWREVNVSFRIPESAVQRVLRAGSSATLSVGARNLYVWSDFSGIDPESAIRSGLAGFAGNEEYFTEAIPTKIFVRLQLTF